jgi:hypothetical protein
MANSVAPPNLIGADILLKKRAAAACNVSRSGPW